MGLCGTNDVLPSSNSQKKATESVDLITVKLRLNSSPVHSQNILGVLNACFTLGLDKRIQMNHDIYLFV